MVVGSCVTVTDVKPTGASEVPPKAMLVVPSVIDEFVKLELAILDNVFAEPEIDTPLSVAKVPPSDSESLPMVTELLVRLPLPMLLSVLLAPLIVLLVSV